MKSEQDTQRMNSIRLETNNKICIYARAHLYNLSCKTLKHYHWMCNDV